MSTKGATIKTKKLSKKFSFSLASPFDLDEKSELIKKENTTVIVNEFKKLCEKYDLALKKPEFDYKLTKEERKKQLNAARLNDPGLKYRSQMFFGLNEVTKSIEKNLVAVVIFNQSLPKIMTKHIKPLCASRNASVLCIQSFNERFSVLLNLRSIQAISFKKCAADEESIFHDFIDMLKTLAPEPCDELKLLINEAQSVSTESSKPDSKSDSVKVLDTRKKKAVKKPVINWDSMYVLKKDFKNPFETENKKIDNFIDLSKFSDDCNPEVALEQNYFRSGSIQKKVEKSEDIYRKLNVAKKIGKPNSMKTKKKKKI